jgi:hypothetical protein
MTDDIFVGTGTAEETMAAFFAAIQRAQEGGPHARQYLCHALLDLVRLYDRQARHGALDPERLQRFRRESGEALAGFDYEITLFVRTTLITAEGAREDDWFELCKLCSAIQALLDDYAETKVAALIDPTDVAELDAEMRRLGEDQEEPVPERHVPWGLPESHWWWHHPP